MPSLNQLLLKEGHIPHFSGFLKHFSHFIIRFSVFALWALPTRTLLHGSHSKMSQKEQGVYLCLLTLPILWNSIFVNRSYFRGRYVSISPNHVIFGAMMSPESMGKLPTVFFFNRSTCCPNFVTVALPKVGMWIFAILAKIFHTNCSFSVK